MTSDIRCPCCNGVLYRVQPRADAPGLNTYVTEPPPVLADELGTYIVCRRCQNRVAVAMGQSALGSDVMVPTDLQTCDLAREPR